MENISVSGKNNHYVVIAALVIAALGYVYKLLSSPLAKIPGPFYSIFTGKVLEYQWIIGNRPKYVENLHHKYGPIVRIGPDEVDITDIPSVKEIHTVKATYIKSIKFYGVLTGPGQQSVFNTTDIYFHRRHRKLLSGGFSDTSLKAMLPTIEQRVKLTIQRMGEEMGTRGVADVHKWWLFMATDVIGELTFGESFRMLELGKKNEYIENLEKVAKASAIRAAFPLLTKISYYIVPLPGIREGTDTAKRSLMYAGESLQRYARLIEKNPEQPVQTLFTRLFRGEEEEELTFKEIRDEAQVYIVAGSDTTAITLTYLVWAVCRNPAIRDRLVAEVRDRLPEDYQDHHVQQLPYLQQVIEEALRVYSAVPAALPRVVPPGGATLAGHYLPGGSVVCTQAYSLHRNADIFPDPEKFDPSRWESPSKEMKDSLMPFGGGSRICIGMHLARIELRLATALFFRTFPQAKVSTLEGMSDDDMEWQLYFLGTPKGKRCLVECR